MDKALGTEVIIALVENMMEWKLLISQRKIKPLVKEFSDVTPEELPSGLLPMRDIQHHINVILGASFSN